MTERTMDRPPTAADRAFERTRSGDPRGFADWVRLVEHPLRSSLRRFARHADVEAIVQETLLRMWVLAPRLELHGAEASLRYALRVGHNLALRESERHRRFEPLDNREIEIAVASDPPPDPALGRAILACIERLPAKPRAALLARLTQRTALADRDLARELGLRVNTFLQNVVRARRAMMVCLESHGIRLPEILR